MNYTVQAANGLASVRLIEQGVLVGEISISGALPVPVSWAVQPDGNTWFSIEVTDQQGGTAWSNPIWVKAE